jgi:hypothetical protein
VIGFPLLLVPFAIYNMIAFLTPMDWGTKLYSVQLKSGVVWEPTAGDAFIVFSLVMLLLEFIKSTRHGKSFVEHFLSLLLAAGATAEFVMVDPAGIMKTGSVTPAANSVFALLIAIIFVDLFAGFAASLRRARRAVVVPEPVPVAVQTPPPRTEAARAEPVRTEPARTEPVRTEPARTEPARTDPFTRMEPMRPAEPRAEPVVKIEPVQKVES